VICLESQGGFRQTEVEGMKVGEVAFVSLTKRIRDLTAVDVLNFAMFGFVSRLDLFSHSESLLRNQVRSFSKGQQFIGGIALAIVWYGLGGGLTCQNGKIVFFYPSVFYDAIQHVFFPLNYLFGLLTYALPTGRSLWSEPGFGTQELKGTGRADIRHSLINGVDEAYNEQDLVLLFDQCPPISAEDLIGNTWDGRIVRTNRSLLDLADWLLVRPLGLFGFKWGKRYRSQHTGDPLLVRWFETIYFPLPIWGNVGMVDIRWRGVPTATMNYDFQPWKDYFRILSDENGKLLLLGVWCHKEVAGGWFVLSLSRGVPT
jgi:hypothetical protein